MTTMCTKTCLAFPRRIRAAFGIHSGKEIMSRFELFASTSQQLLVKMTLWPHWELFRTVLYGTLVLETLVWRVPGSVILSLAGSVQDAEHRKTAAVKQKVRELKRSLGILQGGNYSPQLGAGARSLLNHRELDKLDIEYEKLVVSWLAGTNRCEGPVRL